MIDARARLPKAADISDAVMLALLNAPYGRTWKDIADEHFPDLPAKVVLAKCRQLLRRQLIDGCGCGCGGFFKLKEREASE